MNRRAMLGKLAAAVAAFVPFALSRKAGPANGWQVPDGGYWTLRSYGANGRIVEFQFPEGAVSLGITRETEKDSRGTMTPTGRLSWEISGHGDGTPIRREVTA